MRLTFAQIQRVGHWWRNQLQGVWAIDHASGAGCFTPTKPKMEGCGMQVAVAFRCLISFFLICCLSATTLGQDASSTDALFRQGREYELGQGVPKDLATAIRLYEQAAHQGSTSSMVELGVLKAEGAGGAQDLPGAFALFTQAATAGDAIGEFMLATCYLEGIGTPKDLVAARKWVLPAAAAGKQPAEFTLGIMLANGEGGPRKEFAARRWLDKASTGPDPDTAAKAAAVRDKLDKRILSPDSSGTQLVEFAVALALFTALVSSGAHSHGIGIGTIGNSNSGDLTEAMAIDQAVQSERDEERRIQQKWDDNLRGMRCGLNPPPGCM
jgi:Sel1 repeat